MVDENLKVEVRYMSRQSEILVYKINFLTTAQEYSTYSCRRIYSNIYIFNHVSTKNVRTENRKSF